MTPPAKKPDPNQSDDHSPGLIRLGVGVEIPAAALEFTFSSSSGPGGQNVNRRSTKVRLRIQFNDLPLRPAASRRFVALAGNAITESGDIVISCDSSRSQRANKEECVNRLRELVARSLVAPKPRKATKPSRGSVERRLKAKRIQSQRKSRRSSDLDD